MLSRDIPGRRAPVIAEAMEQGDHDGVKRGDRRPPLQRGGSEASRTAWVEAIHRSPQLATDQLNIVLLDRVTLCSYDLGRRRRDRHAVADPVNQSPDPADVGGCVAAVPALGPLGLQHAVATLPGPEGRRRYRGPPGYFADPHVQVSHDRT